MLITVLRAHGGGFSYHFIEQDRLFCRESLREAVYIFPSISRQRKQTQQTQSFPRSLFTLRAIRLQRGQLLVVHMCLVGRGISWQSHSSRWLTQVIKASPTCFLPDGLYSLDSFHESMPTQVLGSVAITVNVSLQLSEPVASSCTCVFKCTCSPPPPLRAFHTFAPKQGSCRTWHEARGCHLFDK